VQRERKRDSPNSSLSGSHHSSGTGGRGKPRRHSSRSPPRYDANGKRIIELEELESPHHPIWIGVESEDREAYEAALKEEGSGRGREGDRRKGGKGGGGAAYQIGLIGREEGKMIDGRFKDVV
jgi:hypothetical protein